MELLDSVKWDANGLVVAIVQDADTGRILMVAYMNAEALRRTVETRVATYWSRSRGKLWVKGETSGHTQQVQGIRVDCDQDAILLEVRQQGAACHKGYFSCFFRCVGPDGTLATADEQVFDPDTVY